MLWLFRDSGSKYNQITVWIIKEGSEVKRRQTMDERTELKKQRMNYEKLGESVVSLVCKYYSLI